MAKYAAVGGKEVLVGGSRSAGSLGRVGFKATKDIARGDKICTGLCLVSAGCKTLTLICSTIKVRPLEVRFI